MKAKLYDEIITLVDIKTNYARSFIPKGTKGSIVECYENPEVYAVDLGIPDDSLITGYDYENVILFPEQLKIINPINETVPV